MKKVKDKNGLELTLAPSAPIALAGVACGIRASISEDIAEDKGYNTYRVVDSKTVEILDKETGKLISLIDNNDYFVRLCKYFKWEKDKETGHVVSFTETVIDTDDGKVFLPILVACYYHAVPYESIRLK